MVLKLRTSKFRLARQSSEQEAPPAAAGLGSLDCPAGRPCSDLYEDRAASGNVLQSISPTIPSRVRFLSSRYGFLRRSRVQHTFGSPVLSDHRAFQVLPFSCPPLQECAQVPRASGDCRLTASPPFRPQ